MKVIATTKTRFNDENGKQIYNSYFSSFKNICFTYSNGKKLWYNNHSRPEFAKGVMLKHLLKTDLSKVIIANNNSFEGY